MLSLSWISLCFTLNLVSATKTEHHSILQRRDQAPVTSPTRTYAPMGARCPNTLISKGGPNGEAKLSSAEENYIKEKAAKSIPAWREYLNRVKLEDFDVDGFLYRAETTGGVAAKTLPHVGLAISGGGARALCHGGSVLEALDSRNPKANEAKIGGVLQLANYASGVSGGSWLLGSWAISNFPRIPELNQTTWGLTEENDLWDWNIAKHYRRVYKTIKEKKKAGFPISVVDAWGRLLSRHFIQDSTEKDPKEGQGVLWSGIRETPNYKNRWAPFVIALATTRPDTHQPFRQDSPQYEYTPEDFSVWHPKINASMPIEFLGSDSISPTGGCVRGFDNAGFVMAMSSNIFSMGDAPKDSKKKEPIFLRALKLFLHGDDYEGKVPNTFQGLGKKSDNPEEMFQDTKREILLMADSGFINENIPLEPLILPERHLDVIIAVDSSGDGQHFGESQGVAYPNGTSIYTTYKKTLMPEYSAYRMPKIPETHGGTFARLGYNKRPTVFGCQSHPQTPLIVYLPNYHAVAETSIDSAKSTYDAEQINGFFLNGFAITSQSAGPTIDNEWPTCLACFLVEPQLIRDRQVRTGQCEKCFRKYCAQE